MRCDCCSNRRGPDTGMDASNTRTSKLDSGVCRTCSSECTSRNDGCYESKGTYMINVGAKVKVME